MFVKYVYNKAGIYGIHVYTRIKLCLKFGVDILKRLEKNPENESVSD